jgi:hypothetical protein
VLSFDLQSKLCLKGCQETEVYLCAPTPILEYVTLKHCRKKVEVATDGQQDMAQSGHADDVIEDVSYPLQGKVAATRSDHRSSIVPGAPGGDQGLNSTTPCAHCIVSWCIVDCGEGGLLSSAPAVDHGGDQLAQCIHFLPDLLPLLSQNAKGSMRRISKQNT